MDAYVELVMLMSLLVDFLLIIAAQRLCGSRVKWKNALLGAGIGAVYAGACLRIDAQILGSPACRLLVMALISVAAFGWKKSAFRKGAVFVFLNMALGGIALGLGRDGALAFLAAAGGMCILCAAGFHGNASVREYVTVRLTHRGITRELIALKDTGNNLKDPITGRSVLVVGSDVAKQMLGLTQEQLLSPIETLAQSKLAGLRLIPYRSIGKANGMMLAIRMDKVCVDKQEVGDLVAFAPQILGAGEFQALAGGTL